MWKMMTKIANNYKQALVEVGAVLSCLDNKDYDKIPKSIIKSIRENKDESYAFYYNENLEYEDWGLMPEAKAILYNIFKKYLATEEEKNFLDKKERYEIEKLEKQKVAKYNGDRFKLNKVEGKEESASHLPVEVKKESFYEKIINFLKGLFKTN